jgi:hypothetical protein
MSSNSRGKYTISLSLSIIAITAAFTALGIYIHETTKINLDKFQEAVKPIPEITEHVKAIMEKERKDNNPYTWQQLKDDFGIELVCANWKQLPKESIYNKKGITPCNNIVGIRFLDSSVRWIELNGKRIDVNGGHK